MSHTLLYGGTFDPIHHGHLITCQRARELLGADRVLLIPAGLSPHKTTRQMETTAQQRLEMLQLAIAGAKYLAIDGRELLRAGPSYTADTWDELEREQPGERFTLLIGADQLPKFHTWRRAEELLAVGGWRGVAVLPRLGGGREEAATALGEVAVRFGQATADRLGKALLATPLIEISATEIRERVRSGLAIDYLVPAAVAGYIERHGLYRDR